MDTNHAFRERTLRGRICVHGTTGHGLDLLLARGLAHHVHWIASSPTSTLKCSDGMLEHLCRVVATTQHVPSLYALAELIHDDTDVAVVGAMWERLGTDGGWWAGVLALLQWAVHARLGWDWGDVYATLRKSDHPEVVHVSRVMEGAVAGTGHTWGAASHEHDGVMAHMAREWPWDVEWSGESDECPAEVMCAPAGVDVGQPFRLDATGDNLFQLVAVGTADEVGAALLVCPAVDGEGVAWADKPTVYTTRMRLAALAVLLHRVDVLRTVCAVDTGERVCLFSDRSESATLRCIPLDAACVEGRAACIRALSEMRVLDTYKSVMSDPTALLEELASGNGGDASEEERADAFVAVLEGYVGVDAEEATVQSKLSSMISLEMLVAAAENNHSDLARLLLHTSVQAGNRGLLEHPALRYRTARGGHVAVLRALEAEGVMYGAPTTCKETCMAVGVGDKADSWGECAFIWCILCVVCPGLSVIGFICDCCGNNVPAMRHGAPMLGARRSKNADAIEWMRAVQMEVPITQSF